MTTKLDWYPLEVPDTDDESSFCDDWKRLEKDICVLLNVDSADKILTIDSDQSILSEDEFYELAFQDVFGQAKLTNFVCPDGYTKKDVELLLYSPDPAEEDVIDESGYLISKDGVPVLLISYPYGAGVYLYWAQHV